MRTLLCILKLTAFVAAALAAWALLAAMLYFAPLTTAFMLITLATCWWTLRDGEMDAE